MFLLSSITRWQILDTSKLKKFADGNFKFDENSRWLSKRVENNVGKGEIARYEQFLLYPQCFQKARFPGASKGVIVWELVNRLTVPSYSKTKLNYIMDKKKSMKQRNHCFSTEC